MTLQSINTPTLQSICQHFDVRELYAFGSIVSGEMTAESDIDLLVVFDRQSPDGAFDQFMDLKMALEAEFGRSVDLLTLKPFRNTIFQQQIDQTKVLLYAA
jgi:predicted nucleotidyltransferase